MQDKILDMALERCELSPRELAVTFTDEQRYFVSEASVYRLLKTHDLITSPNFITMKGEAGNATGPRDRLRQRVQGQDDRAQPAVAD